MSAPRAGAGAVVIGLIGDHDPEVLAHRAIPLALELAAAQPGACVEWTWVETTSIDGRSKGAATLLDRFTGFWCVPASPYRNTAGALHAIRFAREEGRPFLGTCAGFQHALLEYAGSVWNLPGAAHAEIEPGAADPVIAPLSCVLVERAGRVRFTEGSRLRSIYGAAGTEETYHCRYGLSAAHVPRLADGPLRACAHDDEGDVRAVELDGHPFFIATLFQPERAALTGRIPPLVAAFVAATRASR